MDGRGREVFHPYLWAGKWVVHGCLRSQERGWFSIGFCEAGERVLHGPLRDLLCPELFDKSVGW